MKESIAILPPCKYPLGQKLFPLNINMGCGCSVPDPRIDVPRAFSSRGQYQNIFDGVETDSISLSAFDVDTQSQCSSVNVCEIDEIRPLFSRSDDFKEIEREPVRYSASFKRNRPPSMKYEAISGTFPPVSVANYQPSPTHIPLIRIDHASTSSSNAVASEPMSRLDSNTCLLEKTLSRHIAPIDSLELIPGMNKNVTESALLEKISPPRIAFERKMVQDLSATSTSENIVDENEIGENRLERNASCLVIGKTQSMLSISQSSPNIAAVQKIAEKLVILRKDTNENLRSKASKKEIVPVVSDFISDLIANSEDQLRQEEDCHQRISMIELLESESQDTGNLNCGFTSPRPYSDFVSDLNEMQRFDLLNINFINRNIVQH